MASSTSSEILDLRHFSAPMLRPVLEAEGELWKQRLHWDYRASARLLMQYLEGRQYEEVFSWPEQGLEIYLVGAR